MSVINQLQRKSEDETEVFFVLTFRNGHTVEIMNMMEIFFEN